jgi:transposase-like protein
MSKQRRQYSAGFKFRVALEAAKGQQTISELAGKHSLGCPQGANQSSQWKRQLLESGAAMFAKNGASDQQEAIQVERKDGSEIV